jgi:beta-fructofuranosidase
VPADIAGCWTDMFVFREVGRTFAIFKEAGGLVVEAQNPELTRWQAVGRIDHVLGECPNFIKLQDRWLLLRSTYPMTYQVGRFDPGRIAFEMDGPGGIVDYSYGLNPPPDAGDRNYYLDASGVPVCRYGAPYPAHADSRGFYATSVFADSAGRTLLLAWVGAWPASRGWNCCMSLPRVLSDDPRRLKLHLFYDKSVMELFINDGLQTVTRVALPPSPTLHLEAGATGGTATLRSLTIWRIEHNKETGS